MISKLLIVLLFFLFFSYALINLQIMFPVISVSIIIIFFIKNYNKRLFISKEDTFWFISIIISILGIIKSPDKSSAVIYVGFISIFIILKIILTNIDLWKESYIKYFLIFSSLHVFSTLIQYFLPSIIDVINKIILPNAAYDINKYQFKVGKYAGITGQVGANAFFITMYLSILFGNIFKKKGVYLKKIMFVVGFITLVLTAKRGLLLFNIISIILFMILFRNKKSKKNLFYILIPFFIFIIFILLYYNISLFRNFLINDSGAYERLLIYQSTVKMIVSSPIFGNGLSAVEEMVGIKGHNIYLQLWAELGFLGLFSYLFSMFFTLKQSFKYYRLLEKRKMIIFKKYVLISIYIQIIFILYGLTGNVLYDYFILGIYMVSISLPGLAQNMSNENILFKKNKKDCLIIS